MVWLQGGGECGAMWYVGQARGGVAVGLGGCIGCRGSNMCAGSIHKMFVVS